MNKEQILQLTGLSEDDFYDQYPDQESFCQDYPDMCPEMIYDDSLYEAQDGVETTAPYTDYNQYKNAMQTHFNEVAKANLYNSFQNDLYAYANKKPGFFETNTELQELFNSLSPKQQDALAQKYNAEFITNTPSANRKNYINSMEMNIPGKGMGYYSFPTNDVVYGRKVLERPNYEFPKLTMTPYQSEDDNKPIQILNNLVNLYKNPSFLNSKNGKSPIEKYSLNKTVEKVGAANKYISKPIVSPSTNYTSIVDLLKSRGEDSSFESRKKLAEEAGIKNYIGTASQNMKLLNSFNNNEMKHGGIHINPANKGKFTSWAQAHGMGVQEAASHVMANKEDYSATIVKRANFARNASKWKHEEGGELEQYQMAGQVDFRDQLFPKQKPIVDRGNFSNIKFTSQQADTLKKVKEKERLELKNQLKQEQSARAAKEKGLSFTLPTGKTKTYNQMSAKERAYVDAQVLRNKGRWNENSVDQPLLNMFNPITMVYDMAAGIGEAPIMSDVSGSYLPYVTGTGIPLVTGALSSVGAKTTGQFVNNLINPLAGTGNINKPLRDIIYDLDLLKSMSSNQRKKVMRDIEKSGKDNIDRLSTMKKNIEEGEAWKYTPEEIEKLNAQNFLSDQMRLENEIHPEFAMYFQNLNPNKILFQNIKKSDLENFQNVSGGSQWVSKLQGYSKSDLSKFKTFDDFLKNRALLKSKEFQNTYSRDYKLSPLDFMYLPKNKYGGTSIHPSMRTMFKHGGYYGMDGKFHPNSDSGTYVGGAGYYFQPGGTTVTPSTPPGAGGNPIDITTPNSFSYSNPNVPDANGFYPDGSFRVDQNENYNFDNQNETDPYMTGDPVPGLEKDDDDKFNNTFDDSPYSNQIDPNTGFTTWSKNNKVIRNIKKEDPALWGHLKEEGHGARWATGQTDFQRVGRTVGKIGQGLESAINVAGAIGGYLSNRQKQQNLDKSAMNKGSTASMFTNPEGSSKGDYGVTGSAYGMFKPNQMGNYSFKGMYGKYGMEVPKYAIGGYTPDLSTISDYGLEEKIEVPKVEFRDFSNLLAPFIPPAPLIVSPTDNTRVATQRINSTRNDIPSGIIDVDLALQAVAGIESSSKPGETKVGMRTKLVGKTGKKATASGTYQITEPTLKDIYNNNSNFNKTFKNFNEFKLAFDSNPEVEYAAAKSLMSNHIKNYGIYALGAWYQPSFAKRAMKGDKSVYDIIPSKDEYGNKKTWGQDFKEKLNAYNKIAGTSYNINSSISTKSPSVNIKNLHPNLMQFANVISQTFPGLVLTSGNDSKHMKGSKHYNNKAIDIGASSSNKKDYLNLKNYLKNNPSIKKQYGIEDIIDEGDHLHIELMKKGGQFGGQVVEMDENEIQQFLKAGGQLEFID